MGDVPQEAFLYGRSQQVQTKLNTVLPAVAGVTLQIPHVIIFPHKKSEVPATDGYQHATGSLVPRTYGFPFRAMDFQKSRLSFLL